MSSLTLLRHGQASFGAAHYDALSPLGLQQAQCVAAFFAQREEAFSDVVCGPRQRHRATAQPTVEALSLATPRIDAALDEFAEGSTILQSIERRRGIAVVSDPQFPTAQRLRLYGEEIRLWTSGEIEIDGVESASVFRRRVARWLETLSHDTRRGQNLLAVSSAGVIAAVACELLDLPDQAMSHLMRVIDNASLTTMLWSANGHALKHFNQTAHLPATLLSDI